MIFLTPLPAVLLGAVSLPALLALYFLKLRRRPVRVSSTLLWEQAVRDVEANVPLRMIRPELILLVQLLALLSLLLAVARPVLTRDATLGSRVAIVIDTSASMSARDGALSARGADAATGAPPAQEQASRRPAPTRLDEAKRRATELIDRLAGDERRLFVVLSMAATPATRTPWTSDPATLRRAVEQIEPTDQPADLAAALRAVAALATPAQRPDDADAPPPRPTVLVFSDGGSVDSAASGREGQELSAPTLDVRLRRVGPGAAWRSAGARPAQSTPAPTAPPAPTVPPAGTPTPGPPNAGIIAFSALRDDQAPTLLRVLTRVGSTAPEPTRVPVTVWLDGVPARSETLSLPAATAEAPLAQATLSLEIDVPGAAIITAALPGSDALAADDRASVIVPEPATPSILVVTPSDAPGVRLILASVLDAYPTRWLRALPAPDYEALAAAGRAGRAAGVDLVVFDRVTPATLPDAPSISFGASLPAAPGAAALTLRAGPPAGDAAPERVLWWRREHPLMRDAVLDNVIADPAVHLAFGDAAGRPDQTQARAQAESPALTALARGIAGPLIALRTDPPAAPGPPLRRVAIAFDIDRSNWGPTASFIAFMAAAIETLTRTGSASAAVAHTTADPVLVTPADARADGSASVTVSGPDGADPPRTLGGTLSPDGLLSLGVLPRAGLYAAQGLAGAPPAIAVNLASPAESALTTAGALPVAGSLPDGADPAPQRAGAQSPGQRAGEALGGREVWHIFVWIALGLLTLEWFLYALRARA